MSSTNRGGIREISDYYITPQWAILDFLKAFESDTGFEGSDEKLYILDPCAGGDEKNGMAYPTAIEKRGVWCGPIVTNDIRDDSPAQFHTDYTSELFNGMRASIPTPDIIITNPPFAIAQDIIRVALKHAAQGGWVIMLLRLNFFGSEGRKSWWKQNMPVLCYVHAKRIGFKGHMGELGKKERNGTDSIEYVHCCWRVGENPEFTNLRII